ncbi:MAG: type III-A CRISPR-associated RAMP protein Csm5 [Candidatus Zixiibacteriota bacterium]|nr:MAG: type III-A CRISPR-associated RAMP protein Csm5 [candidate division Zixibacteria bacterium]
MNNHHKLRLKVLTPIHIGSGSDITPAEYFYSEGKCNVINMTSLASDDSFKPFFEKYLEKTIRHVPIANYVPFEILDKHILYSMNVFGQARNKLANNAINIKSCIKSAGLPYLPGSSIKGSIMSAMVYFVLKTNYPDDNQLESDLKLWMRNANSRRRNFDYNELQKYVMPKLGKQNSGRFVSWLKISDSSTVEISDSLNVYFSEVIGARTQSKLPILYEAISEGSEFIISVDTSNCYFDIEEIKDVLFDFFNGIYELDENGAPYNWEAPEDSILLRLGQGSTAFSTSLLVLAKDLGLTNDYKLKPPRTRKRIEGVPMGWLEILDDE